jgi:type III secretion protein C
MSAFIRWPRSPYNNHKRISMKSDFVRRALSRLAGLAVFPLLMATTFGLAHAAAIPWDSKKPMSPIVARDMPLHEFMQVLLADQGLQAIVSPAVAQKTVNGRYQGDASKVFSNLVNSYALLPYFDGSTVYIYATSESVTKSRSLSQASAARVISTLAQLRLHDGKYNTFASVPASGLLQIRGAKPFVDQVEEVVTSVQKSAVADPQEIGVFALKHAWAWDVTLSSGGKQIVVPGVASMLRTLLGGLGPVVAMNRTRASVGKLRGKGFAAGNETDALTRAEETARDNAEFDSEGRGELRGKNGNGPTVVAEVRTNSVVVRDTSDRLPRYAELIKALDVEPVMVELETTIIDVKTDRLNELGVNWRFGSNNNEIRLGQGNSSDTGLASTILGNITPIGRGLTWSTILDRNRLVARISALAATGDARIVSRSQVATLANLESVIESNQTFYVKVEGFQEVDLFPVTATTNVRITPRVSSTANRQLVNMVVSIRDGKLAEAVASQIPSVKEVSLNTHGIIPENQTFVLGGFKQERTTNRADKVPFLGDLPVVGAAFRSTSNEIDNTERLFLITPRVRTVDQLIAASEEIQNLPAPNAPPVEKPKYTPRPSGFSDPVYRK